MVVEIGEAPKLLRHGSNASDTSPSFKVRAQRLLNASNTLSGKAIMRCALVVLATILASAIPAVSQTTSSTTISAFDRQLIDWQKHFLEAAQNHNETAVDQTIAEDFRGIGPNGDFYDKSEVIESVRKGMPKNTRAYDFYVIKLTGASAVVTYNLIIPEEHPRYCHMADTWARIEGRWKLKFRQITPNLWSQNDVD